MRTGSNLSAVFKDAWTKGGGTIPKFIIYNQTQPTLDSEAQQPVEGSPDGWLFIDFCNTFEKLALPLTRTGKWDAAKSFGSDTLNDCAGRGSKTIRACARRTMPPEGRVSRIQGIVSEER